MGSPGLMLRTCSWGRSSWSSHDLNMNIKKQLLAQKLVSDSIFLAHKSGISCSIHIFHISWSFFAWVCACVWAWSLQLSSSTIQSRVWACGLFFLSTAVCQVSWSQDQSSCTDTMLRKRLSMTQTGKKETLSNLEIKRVKVSHKDIHVKVTEQHFSFPGSARCALIFSADVLCVFGKYAKSLWRQHEIQLTPLLQHYRKLHTYRVLSFGILLIKIISQWQPKINNQNFVVFCTNSVYKLTSFGFITNDVFHQFLSNQILFYNCTNLHEQRTTERCSVSWEWSYVKGYKWTCQLSPTWL